MIKKKKVDLTVSIIERSDYRFVKIEIEGIDAIERVYAKGLTNLEDTLKSVNELILFNIDFEIHHRKEAVWET